MNRLFFLALFILGQLGATVAQAEDKKAVVPHSGDVYVLVHGAWGGGWAWKEVQRLLEAEGHTVYRPTLTGHGERVHLSDPNIDLSLHIQDVVNLIKWEELEDVILLGHSYGGMVVTGVADQVPERIRRLVYVDAIVPEDGESVNAAFGQERALTQDEESGFVEPRWVEEGTPIPHDVPHSVKCFSEPISLENPGRDDIEAVYLYLVDPGKELEEDTFHKFYLRAQEKGWKVIVKEEWDHNPQWSHPKELATLLQE